MEEIKIEVMGENANVYTPYSSIFVKKINGIGGARWNSSKRCWIVPVESVDAIREIMRQVYGKDDSPAGECETLKLRIIVKKELSNSCDDVNLFGKCLCHATGRDSGGRPGNDVFYVAGKPNSGGSVKNWKSIVPVGSEIILSNVSKLMYEEYVPNGDVSMELVQEEHNKGQLLIEKEKLLKRLAEIDSLLLSERNV